MLGGRSQWANDVGGVLGLGIGAIWGYLVDLLSQLSIEVDLWVWVPRLSFVLGATSLHMQRQAPNIQHTPMQRQSQSRKLLLIAKMESTEALCTSLRVTRVRGNISTFRCALENRWAAAGAPGVGSVYMAPKHHIT